MDTDGIPLRMSTFPGNQNEQISIDKKAIREICKYYEVGQFVYCADAGLGSSKIKEALNGYAFPCADIVTQSIKKLPEAEKSWALDENRNEYWSYRKYDQTTKQLIAQKTLFNDIPQDNKNENIYYREKWHWNKNGKPERLIVTYSPKYAYYLQEKNQHIKIRYQKSKIDFICGHSCFFYRSKLTNSGF